jgi:WD40 repeat protein
MRESRSERRIQPDGLRLATAGKSGVLTLWNASSKKKLRTIAAHERQIYALVFDREGSRLATASEDRTAKAWDVAPGATRDTPLVTVSRVEGKDWVSGVAFSPDGKRLATTNADKTTTIWDVSPGAQDNKALVTLYGHTDQVYGVAFSADGKQLVTASRDRSVKVWNSWTGQLMGTLLGHADDVRSVAIRSDGSQIASASWDKSARIWYGLKQGPWTLSGHDSWVLSVAFSPDRARLASASADQTMKIWDVLPQALSTRGGASDGKPKVDVDVPDGPPESWYQVDAVAFSPDGKLATGSRDGIARIGGARTGRKLLTLSGHSGKVSDVAFQP